MPKLLLIAACVIGLALAPATALAQDPTQDAYHPTTRILGEVGSIDPPPSEPKPDPPPTQPLASAESAGTLPFTGTDVLLLVAGGALLLGLGVGVRRFSRPAA